MKAKVVRGDNFKSCLEYVTKKEGAYCIGGSVIGNDGRMMAKEFLATIPPQRRNIKKPVWHCSLSLPKGEKLSNDEWMNIVNSYMGKMNISPKNRAYSVIRHNDTNYDHIHFVASRVDIDGNLWSNENDVYKSLDATQELEKEYSLTQTKGYNPKKKKSEKTPSYKEVERTIRTGESTQKKKIETVIKAALKNGVEWGEFSDILNLNGIGIQLHKHRKTEQVYGISYKLGDVAIKGSKLGKSYTLKGLEKRGLAYDKIREGEQNRSEGNQEQSRTNQTAGESESRDNQHDGGAKRTTVRNSRSNSRKNSSAMVSGGKVEEVSTTTETTREFSKGGREIRRHVEIFENKNVHSASFGGVFRGKFEQLDKLRSESMGRAVKPNLRGRIERIEREKKKELEQQRINENIQKELERKKTIERKAKEEEEEKRKLEKRRKEREERRRREAERGGFER